MRGLLRCPKTSNFFVFCELEIRTFFHNEGVLQIKSFFDATFVQALENFSHESWTTAQPRQKVTEFFQKTRFFFCEDALHTFPRVVGFLEKNDHPCAPGTLFHNVFGPHSAWGCGAVSGQPKLKLLQLKRAGCSAVRKIRIFLFYANSKSGQVFIAKGDRNSKVFSMQRWSRHSRFLSTKIGPQLNPGKKLQNFFKTVDKILCRRFAHCFEGVSFF